MSEAFEADLINGVNISLGGVCTCCCGSILTCGLRNRAGLVFETGKATVGIILSYTFLFNAPLAE